MNWAFFIEKQQQQQYAITTTTKQKTKQNQTNKQTVEKTETAKTFRFNEMTILGISTFAFFSQTTSPRGWVLPNMGYCMCYCEGYGLQAIYSGKGSE